MICLWVGSVSAVARDDAARWEPHRAALAAASSPSLPRRVAHEKVIVSPRQDGIEVTLRFEVEPVKVSQLVEETPPNDEDVFVRRGHLR